MSEITSALRDVIAERKRQVEKEGWSTDHDDDHEDGSLARAAAAYAWAASRWDRAGLKDIEGNSFVAFILRTIWPDDWSYEWWKPKSKRRDLVRAAALTLAEIEKIDREKATRA
jgi:hypothetical protein